MKTKTIIRICISFLFSVSLVVVLFLLSKDIRSSHNSFLRNFPPHVLEAERAFNVGHNGYYIAGATDFNIYLGNYVYPLHILQLDIGLTDTVHIMLDIESIMEQMFWSLKIKIDSPNFYAYDGVVPRIYYGSVFNWKGKRFPFDAEYFQDIEPLDSRRIAVRSLEKDKGINMIGFISLDSPHYRFSNKILKKQIDGVFCTEGFMKFNKSSGSLFYLYRYRNQLLEVDTGLNVIKVGRTIDTVSVAKIEIDRMDNQGSTTFASPPLMVNKRMEVSQNLIFVNSDLVARNEPLAAHKQADVVDVYSLDTMDYMLSFYIHNYDRKQKVRHFVVRGDKLIVLFDTYIQSYRFKPNVFETGVPN